MECGLNNGSHLSQKGNVVLVTLNYGFGMFSCNFTEENITNMH
jgi:carboxylesterase type B